jgi:hypothetical protein
MVLREFHSNRRHRQVTGRVKAPSKRPRSSAKSKVKGSGAIAQGKGAKAAGKRGVIVEGDSAAPISTGSGDVYQTIVNQAAQLFAGDSGKPAQLASVYTALLTQARATDEANPQAAQDAARSRAGRDADRQSALEALNAEKYLVLMGGPGSGKTTFLNYVALCMAGELLGLGSANLKLLRRPIPPEPGDDPNKRPKPQRWTHKGLLPVRVLLRDFAAGLPPAGAPVTADALWLFIVDQLPELLRRHADDLQAELLGKGGLILPGQNRSSPPPRLSGWRGAWNCRS